MRGEGDMGPMVFDAIALSVGDNVATVLRAVSAGDVLRVKRGDTIIELAAAESVPMGHKLALGDIASGAPIVKYGTTIGEARIAIARGAHVHVHNLRSRRAAQRAD